MRGVGGVRLGGVARPLPPLPLLCLPSALGGPDPAGEYPVGSPRTPPCLASSAGLSDFGAACLWSLVGSCRGVPEVHVGSGMPPFFEPAFL